MVDGGPRFLEDHAKISANPPTRQTTLFLALIANSNSALVDPFTLTAGNTDNGPNLINP